MRLLRAATTIGLAVIAVACYGDGPLAPPARFAYSVAIRSCGPTDGPATQIFLASRPLPSPFPDAPYIGISIWASPEHAVGKTAVLGPSSLTGIAWYHVSNSEISPMIGSGTAHITSINADDGTIDGRVDLALPNEGHITGGFHAKLFPHVFLCV